MDMALFTLKRFHVILVILMITSSSTCKVTMANYFLPVNSVEIENDFNSNGKSLYVHCHSADDDLGEHWLSKGQNYKWSFNVNLWGTTLFDCYAQWGDKKKSFKAYDFSGYKCCEDKGSMFWSLNEAGIVARNNERNFPITILANITWN